MQSGPSRRAFFGVAAGLAAVVTGGQLLTATLAEADPQLLPPVGARLRRTCSAKAVPIRIGTARHTADFSGDITLGVEANADDPTGKSRRLRVLGHRVEADTAQFGKITITENVRPAGIPPSLLKLTKESPPAYELTLTLRLNVEIERFSMGALDLSRFDGRLAHELEPRLGKTLTLVNSTPAILENKNLSTFLPHGDSLRLRAPVALAIPWLPIVAVATMEPFSVQVGEL